MFLLSLVCAAVHAQGPPDTLAVGGDSAFPPFEWVDHAGTARGFNVELMRLLVDASDTRVEFQLGAWAPTLAALDNGELDVVPMFVSDERRKDYRFTNIYYYQTHALFGLAHQPAIDSLDKLVDLDLVVEARSLAETQLQRLDRNFKPRLSADTFQALSQVARGDVDYALLAAPVARELIALNGWDIELKSTPFWPRGYAFAVKRDREQLAQWLQARLVEVISNGQYLELYNGWSARLEPGVDYSSGYIRFIQWLLLAVVLGVFAIAIWNFALRRQVAHRTGQIAKELESRKRAERQAHKLAQRDPITSLANVRYFCGRCSEMLQRQPDGAVAEIMLIRLPELDSVIRSFGYPVAERMIMGFSTALTRTFDEPIAHLGRGTFAVFDVSGAASTRLDALEQAIEQDETLVNPRFIAGSAHYPADAVEINELLQKAELALAESRQQQCRWTRYRNELQSDPIDIQIVESFRRGRLEGMGFVLQAQMSLSDGRICGCELLARWHHPELGEITPAHFVPLLEKAGLIDRLTELALAEAAVVSNVLREHDLAIEVSVNVSAHDLADPQFHRRVATLLARHSVECSTLKFEITETGLVHDREAVRENLNCLSALDIGISLDDFGTGYSSLDYISRFPVNEVKIDRLFVSRMLDSPRDFSIVRSTIAMAHEMEMTVVGEGAETQAHLDALAELGCDLAQGWAIGYPQPRDEFIELLRASRISRSKGPVR
ncbi:MAG: EAL domain-containing protein [Wenzhouxiangellaceae bacterium]|nr:EAL domain-containing protein [Wenzhouxiangellaceae bacterium]